MTYYDRVRFAVSGTPGTGAITVGTVASGFVTPATAQPAAIADATALTILIEDGSAWEVCDSVYTVSGTSLSRGTLIASSTGARLSLTSAAVVSVSVPARDLQGIRGYVQIGATKTFSGDTTHSITDLAVGDLMFLFQGVQVASGTANLTLAASIDNGSGYGTARPFVAAGAVTTTPKDFTGSLMGLNVGAGYGLTMGSGTTTSGASYAGDVSAGADTSVNFPSGSAINAIRFAISASNLSAGTLKVFGR